MSESTKIKTKAPKTKRENAVSQTRKSERSQFMHSPVDRLLFLLRTVGNQAVQRMMKSGGIQSRESRISDQDYAKEQKAEHMPRSPAQIVQVSSLPMVMGAYTLTPEEKAENLKSPRFAGDPRLEAAFDNNPTMRRGERGEAVKKIQQALIDDGFDMPISSKKTRASDGIFGKETKRTVQKFQRKHKVHFGPDGIIGRFTMGKLDELYAGPGPAPPEKKPEIETTEKAMGLHIVDTMEKANDPSTYSPNSGIWYAHNYKAAHDKSPALYPWDDDYRKGYANPTYFNRINRMDWRLKPGVSASQGIKVWLKGLTIAECLTAVVAIEIDTLRAAIGDTKFDKNFGSTDVVVPEAQRLRIKQGTKGTPVEKYIKRTEASAAGTVGTKGNRPVKKGEWYYFYNHPKYLLKHPDGAFQGENAVYMGKNPAGQQLWSGLGISKVTEDRMLFVMMKDYNDPRRPDDYRKLVRTYASSAPELTHPNPDYKAVYEKYIDRIPDKYRHDKGEYEEKITKNDILNDPAYTLGRTTRKGGFLPRSGIKLDVAKVKQLREE